MALHLFILIGLLIIPAILAAFAADLVRSAIALLVASLGLTLVFFNLNAPYAGVFELSVCAGLISVLFILTISLTSPLNSEARTERKKLHYQRFVAMPIAVLVVAGLLWLGRGAWIGAFPLGKIEAATTIGEVLWNGRGLDLIGQVAILLVGVYGVVVLIKRGKME